MDTFSFWSWKTDREEMKGTKSKRRVDHCWKIHLESSTKQVVQTQAMKAGPD